MPPDAAHMLVRNAPAAEHSAQGGKRVLLKGALLAQGGCRRCVAAEGANGAFDVLRSCCLKPLRRGAVQERHVDVRTVHVCLPRCGMAICQKENVACLHHRESVHYHGPEMANTYASHASHVRTTPCAWLVNQKTPDTTEHAWHFATE